MLFGKAKKEGTSKVTPSLGRKNGSTPRPATAAQEKKPVTRPRDARQARFAQSFAQIVAVLMRDPNFRNMRLADLQWLVLPPVMAGQFRLAQVPMPQDTKGQEAGKAPQGAKAQEGGVLVPMAVALWARVSPDIDKGLSESLDKDGAAAPEPMGLGQHRVADGGGWRPTRQTALSQATGRDRVQRAARENAVARARR